VTVTATPETDSVCIIVQDTGSGIPREELPLIFQRFWQGGGSNGENRSGLGLGLPLTRRLVELHGGTITATSNGPGSRFVVSLPGAAVG
jgi:signal transduction histidine kinase